MKTLSLVILFVFLMPLLLQAQDSTNAKIDSILYYQKRLADLQDKIYIETVRYKEPLANKNYGIEFNPAYFLVGTSRSIFILSGGFSFFAVDRAAEIACPIFIQSGKNDYTGSNKLFLWNQDIRYRRFLGQHQDGFYIEGGLRFTHIRGEYIDSNLPTFFSWGFPSDPFSAITTTITTDKLGMMFGVGYRYFSSSGLYWGISMSYGTYFSADERTILGAELNCVRTIWDFEILKFGYAF